MANLCIKTPSSASLVLIFQLLVLRPRPIAHHLKNGHFAVGFRLAVHRQKYESITLHPNLFPEMKGVNLLLKTHRNNDKSNLKLKTVLQELLHVDIFS